MFIIQLQNGLGSHQLLLSAPQLLLVSIHFLKHSGCVGEHDTRVSIHEGTCLHFLLMLGYDGYRRDFHS